MNSDDTVIYHDVHTLILSTITIDYGRHDENIWSRYSTIIFMCVKRRKKNFVKKSANVGLPHTPSNISYCIDIM